MKHVAYAVVGAWRRSRCRGCGGRIEVGELARFVVGVGPCCSGCYVTVDRDALALDHLQLVRAVARHLRLDTGRGAAPVDRDDRLVAGEEALVPHSTEAGWA